MSIKMVLEAWKGKPLDVLLRELYVDQNMNMKEVADSLHISVGMVHKYLTEYGIFKVDNLWQD